ncbi:MAG: hypothetical protein AAFN93_29260, partial [Bacteroidota bacterium]
MATKKYTVSTSLDVNQVIIELSKITSPKGSIIERVKGKRLIGQVAANSLIIKTYDSPPTEIIGNILRQEGQTEILLDIKYESEGLPLKMLTYALLFPILIVFFIWQVVVDPRRISLYFITTIIGVGIYLLGRIQGWMASPPNPDHA